MLQELPRLEFLPICSLILHERHDDQRTMPLVNRIRESGIFRNPPIVAPLQDGSNRFMVLDGANRFTALRQMGFVDILTQVVQPADPGLRLHTWNHVIWGLAPAELLDNLFQIHAGTLIQAQESPAHPDLLGECDVALVELPTGENYTICTQDDGLLNRINLLNAVVDSYKDRAQLDRTSVRDIDLLRNIYAGLSGLVIFPHFDVADVLELAGAGCLLPAGITRFTIAPRALHVNYPLSELEADKPLAEKNASLQRWIQERIARKGVRYYAEPTFLFDE